MMTVLKPDHLYIRIARYTSFGAVVHFPGHPQPEFGTQKTYCGRTYPIHAVQYVGAEDETPEQFGFRVCKRCKQGGGE